MSIRHGKVDDRTLRTRNALSRALVNLGGQKPVDDIDVRELTKHAGVARSTFYLHFSSMGDFLATSYANMLAGNAARGGREAPNQVLATRYILEHVHRSARFARAIHHARERPRMLAAGEAKLRTIAEQNLRLIAPALKSSERQAVATFIAGGFMGLLRRWTETGLRERPETIRARFEAIVERVVRSR